LPTEFERQVSVFVRLGYPALAGLDPAAFRELFQPIGRALDAAGDASSGELALVVTRALIAPERRVPLLALPGSNKAGIVDKNHFTDALPGLSAYAPLPGLSLPASSVYALLGVDRGDEFRNVVPEKAVETLAARGRTPLTIDEGISLLAVHPALLEKNHCFMLAGSERGGGDRRMPALWISDGAPKLGWCYKGNPHGWLGVASTALRMGPL
jgi:hypothetical protein